MEINFQNRKLAKVFNSESELRKEYGPKQARTIMRRLAFIQAAQCLEDVPADPPCRRHKLKGSREGQFAVDLDQPYRLIFEPDHNPVPTKPDGGINLKGITAVTIVGVEDYHR